MIDNFERVKQQLAELATVINSFKSEAVQLRIVELILGGEFGSAVDHDDTGQARPHKKKRKTRKKSKKKIANKKTEAKASNKKRTRKAGPATVLTDLIDDGFFKDRNTISDIIAHCSSKKARIFKANELSTPLARFVRDGRLHRDQNADGQYEYYTE